MKHIMLDLETMGTGNNAAIVAIGACEFDPHDAYKTGVDSSFYKAVTLESSVKAGLVMDASTVLWWLQQSDGARRSTFPERVSVENPNGAVDIDIACSYFCGFVERRGKDVAIWGNGATFDNVIIRSAFRVVGLPVPWSFRNDKCYRTVINLLPKERQPALERNGTAHNALDDAITQAVHLQKCYKILGI